MNRRIKLFTGTGTNVESLQNAVNDWLQKNKYPVINISFSEWGRMHSVITVMVEYNVKDGES